MSEEDSFGQQSANKGDGDESRAKSRWPKLNTPEWVTALATVAAAVAAIVAVVIAWQTYRVAKDTGELEKAVSTISDLAKQTKRQADDSDSEVKTIGKQFGEMQKQTTAFQTSATAAQGQLGEMRYEQQPVVDIATIESAAPLQTNPVFAVFVRFDLVNAGKSTAVLRNAKIGFNIRTGCHDSCRRGVCPDRRRN